MINRYAHKGITWIDLESPTNTEVRELMETYALPPDVAEELLLPTPRPKVELRGESFIYLVLHFPAFKHTHGEEPKQEVDFLIGKKLLITTRYETVDPLHKFSKMFEVDSTLDRTGFGDDTGMLLTLMIKKLYRSLEHEVAYIDDELAEIEAHLFEGMEKENVVAISLLNRDLLSLKHILNFHEDTIDALELAAKKVFGEDFAINARAIKSAYRRLYDSVISSVDTADELRETNNSLLSSKQNEVMKTLTIMAFVTFPLSLIASIFSLNTSFIPIVGLANDFWIVMGIMVTATTAMFIFFKYKHWL